MARPKKWEDVMNLLTENKDMKKMFADMNKLQKEMEALKKRIDRKSVV